MCICFLHCFLWHWSWCRDGVWHKSVQKDRDGSRQSSWDRGHAQSRQSGVTLYRSSAAESCVSITPHPAPRAEHRTHPLISISLPVSGLSPSTAHFWLLQTSDMTATSPGFGCSAHINTTSNLWAQSPGAIWKSQSGFCVFFLWFVCFPSRTWEADPPVEAFIRLAEVFPIWISFCEC